MNSQLNRVHFLFVPTMLVLLCCFMAPTSIAMVEVLNINTDKSSLLALKDHISYDPNNFLAKNWSVKASVCNWIGITCSSSHLRVIVVDLSSMNLVGEIPPHLGNLSFLSKLDLTKNSIHGYLPSELAQLRRLKLISLTFNNFSGEIPPWFAILPKVEKLWLDHNSFTGHITPSLFNITSLRSLDLGFNQLWGLLPSNFFQAPALEFVSIYGNHISGSIPTTVSNISLLQTIDLGNNNLSGEVPKNIFYHLPNLQRFSLLWNHFSGEIPFSLFSCEQLQSVILSHNGFEGNIPREIGNLTMLGQLYLFDNKLQGSLPSTLGSTAPNLEKLYLGGNYLSGKIPSSISNASMLTRPDLPWNSFSGYFPNNLNNLRKLKTLNLGVNKLTCDPELSIINYLSSSKYLEMVILSENPLNSILPMSIGNLSKSLERLEFGSCGMSGSIPANIVNLSSLISIDLSENQLTGTIPTGRGNLQKLQSLTLRGNMLEGRLPRVICQLKSLWILELDRNMFSGPIPGCMGNLTSLGVLSLATNKFNMTIPSNLLGLTNLLFLNISSNELTGYVLPDIANLKAVAEIYLSDNQLSGNIPSSIGRLQDLVNLSLARNQLQGRIPESLGSSLSLEHLDLSKNHLSGTIPKSLEALVHLNYFNVSYNQLEGEIPSGGAFKNLSVLSFTGNEDLCGGPGLQVPSCKTATSSKSRVIPAIVLKVVLPLGVATVLISIIVYVLKWRKHSKPSNAEEDSSVTTWRRISYRELQQATNQFNDDNLLGTGSFGKVYKGILADGTNIAVKVFNLEFEGGIKSFDSECEVFQNVRHRNLIRIISSCSNDIDFKALILSYMPNGSLERWLYSNNYCLSIIQRMNIMIDVAAALEYLHFGCSIPIVHCDLKPSNILLDQYMVAHVTDFGIAKLLGGDSFTHTMTLATMGYMAPEYGLEGTVSRQGDVYNYGILLMETFTGKKPTDAMFHGELNIKHWVKDSLSDAMIDFISGQLLTEDIRHIAVKEECLLSILRLALDCSADSPTERSNMKDVLAALQKIKTKFLNETWKSQCIV